MIEVRDLSYRAGKLELLKKISFTVHPGEMLAVIGANGAGKSTLLRLLSRDMSPASGLIRLRGKELQHYRNGELAAVRGVLTQQNIVSMPFKVRELVLMGRYPHYENRPSSSDHDIVAKVLKETGIDRLAERQYNTLSGGEQQRAQLARVLAQVWDVEGGFLFLDEPVNGLDILYQQQILSMAKKMAGRGFCVICILHDINYAARYANKILLLKKGEVVAFGAPAEVISSGNIFHSFGVRVKLVSLDGFDIPLVVPLDADAGEGNPVAEVAYTSFADRTGEVIPLKIKQAHL